MNRTVTRTRPTKETDITHIRDAFTCQALFSKAYGYQK